MRAMKKVRILLTLCAVAIGAAGCGGGGNEESKAAYRSDLARISKEAGTAHQRVEQGAPQATTIAQVQALLRRFASDEDKIGDDISKLNPPKNARDANAELARSQHDDADEVRAVIPKLAKYKSVQQAFAFLQTLGHTKGGREGDDALAKLKQLGYTNGS
jgi:hypothetical protein